MTSDLQLVNGDVYYVDKGLVAESQIGLRMSNKRSKTNGGVITLRIQSFRLEVLAVNNTGLALASGGSALITPNNLTFTTNAPGQSINIRRVRGIVLQRVPSACIRGLG